MERYKLKIFRILVIAGLIMILLQIYLLPSQKPYLDLVLVEIYENDWRIAASVEVKQNQSLIYPFVRNVMAKIILIKLQIYGLIESPSDENFQNKESLLTTNTSSTWILKPERSVKKTNFHSNWVIKPWNIYNISNSMKFIVLMLSIYQNHNWQYYNWVSLIIIK